MPARFPFARICGALCGACFMLAPLAAIPIDVIRSDGAVPAYLAGRFREPIGFQQSNDGQFFIFDRRAHTVYGMDAQQSTVWEIVQIGAEPGRIIDPTAFAVEPGGSSFAVADAPNNRDRIQIFTAAGFRIGGFFLAARAGTRVRVGNSVLNGIGTLLYTGSSVLIPEPDSGALVDEYDLKGSLIRAFGHLRSSGHEDDRMLHFALNSGIVLADPSGGFYFVFQAGEPVFRRYDASGGLIFERRIEGREIDSLVADRPTTWPRRQTDSGEVPVVSPLIYTAAVDRRGRLWIALADAVVYVYDSDGDKIRAVRLQAAGTITPSSMFFGTNDRLLVTPGLVEFHIS